MMHGQTLGVVMGVVRPEAHGITEGLSRTKKYIFQCRFELLAEATELNDGLGVGLTTPTKQLYVEFVCGIWFVVAVKRQLKDLHLPA